MATPKGKAAKAEKAPKKERVKKDSFLKDNYVVVNDFRNEKGTGVVTSASHIRSVGTQVREEAYQDGKLVGVSSNFIPGVKIKTKKDWKFLIIDKGPKSKKDEEAED
jgi:antitoxin component YwqK of YwqJK toxin-antitoxin module